MMIAIRRGFSRVVAYVNRSPPIVKGDEILDGTRVWFVFDLHFGSRSKLKWARRSHFRNLHDMHSGLIENWNRVVGWNDRVYCLGDFGDHRYREKLKGEIIPTKGNNDRRNWPRQHLLTYREKQFLALHNPRQAGPWFTGDWIIHGHTHINSPFVDLRRRRINVCVEMINFTPISMERIWEITEACSQYPDNRRWY